MTSKTITGTASQYAPDVIKPNFSLGFTPYFSIRGAESVDSNPTMGVGGQSARMKAQLDSGALIDGRNYIVSVTGGSYNDNFGCLKSINPNVQRYGVVNFQVMVKFPTGWDFTAGGGHLKFLRLHTRTPSDANTGYLDVYVNDADRALWYIYEGASPSVWTLPTAGYELRYDEWETIEYRVVLDSVAKDSGGEARATIFIQRGNDFIKILDCTDKVTLQAADGYVDQFNLFTYWNGTAPQDQSMYVQRLVVETDQSKMFAEVDGMKIIGGEYINA